MTRALYRRVAFGFVPEDDQAREQMHRVPIGKSVYMETIAARNRKQHRLLMALLQVIVEAGEHPSIEAALTALKIATGHVNSFTMTDTGEVHFIVKSIAFANMRQAEFEPWFDGALRVVTERWLPGVTSAELRRQIEDMVGGPVHA